MSSSHPNQDDAFRIVVQIRRIVRTLHLHSQQLSRTVGLTVPQLVLLQTIQESEGGWNTATRMCDAMGVNPATMSGLVDRLVKRGYLSRTRAEHDRRIVKLRLTDDGQQVLAQAPAPLQDQVLDRLRELPPEKRTEILASLDQIVALMQAEAVDASPLLTDGTHINS